MLSSTLLVVATSLLTRIVAAASAPVCAPSSDLQYDYQTGQINYLFNTFCNQLASNKFASQQQLYGMPMISFDYTSTSTSKTGDLDSCLASYQTLVKSCALPNATVSGSGSIDAGYGLYKFSIWSSADYPAAAVGSATTTILGATLTTAPLITMTSSSSYSLISTSSSSSSPVSTAASLTASPSMSSSVYYSNGTSTSSTYVAASGSGIGASASVTGSPIVPVLSSTTTTPAAGKTSAASTKNSGAETVRSSGLKLVALACVAMWWV